MSQAGGSSTPARVGAALEQALRTGLGDSRVRLLGLRALGGGCISHAARLETSAGPFFAKWNDAAPAGMFAAEAACLRALAAADGGPRIPRVVWACAAAGGHPALLVTEYLEPGPQRPGDEEALGRGLAAVHRVSAETFGFPATTYCGSTPQDNTPTESWAEFYARRRLEPLIEAVAGGRGLPTAERRVYERVAAHLPELVADREPPALVHGDMWSGNVLHTISGPALIDPSCTFADREMEFGISTLFGGFGRVFWQAYDEAWPLSPGWRERNGLYQLYHLLNHYLLFGGHYGGQALAAARRYA